MSSFTGIKSKEGGKVVTFWINGKKVTKEQWEAYQGAFAELRPKQLLKKARR